MNQEQDAEGNTIPRQSSGSEVYDEPLVSDPDYNGYANQAAVGGQGPQAMHYLRNMPAPQNVQNNMGSKNGSKERAAVSRSGGMGNSTGSGRAAAASSKSRISLGSQGAPGTSSNTA